MSTPMTVFGSHEVPVHDRDSQLLRDSAADPRRESIDTAPHIRPANTFRIDRSLESEAIHPRQEDDGNRPRRNIDHQLIGTVV